MIFEPQFNRLRVYNIFMGFLHLAQAIFIIILSNNFTLPITTSFLTYDESIGKLWPATDTLVNLPLGIMVAVFLLISAVAHFTVASPGTFDWYVNNLKKGINYARWYEYSLSASLMIVLIGMLCGVYDLAALIMAFVLTAVMNLCGLIMEVHNQVTEKTNWTSYVVGCIAGVAPWVAIAPMARLSFRRKGIRFPESGCQVCPRLAGLRWDVTTGLSGGNSEGTGYHRQYLRYSSRFGLQAGNQGGADKSVLESLIG